jgi:hypothetical protein
MPVFLVINRDVLLEGLLMSVIGYIVVLASLAALYYVFRYLPNILHWQIRSRLRKQGIAHSGAPHSISGDELAAISTALYLYFNEVHDEERTIMTIRKVSKTYSPWSSKIFGVMNKTWKR